TSPGDAGALQTGPGSDSADKTGIDQAGCWQEGSETGAACQQHEQAFRQEGTCCEQDEAATEGARSQDSFVKAIASQTQTVALTSTASRKLCLRRALKKS